MTNQLVGDVYLKIIEEVVRASTNDFEESGVGQATLGELQQEWQAKLSQRQVAQMPWDPRPDAVQRPVNGLPTPSSNGGQSYTGYENDNPNLMNGRGIKSEVEPYQPAPPVFTGSSQGGAARAQQLVEQQFGSQAAAALQQRGGLALPGQKPQGLHLPGQAQQQYSQQQQQHVQRQQQALQNQQQNPQIKLEEGSPNLQQGQFAQRSEIAYNQTDGADEEEQWRAFMAYRRTIDSDTVARNDHMMRNSITLLARELENGLMLPFDEKKSRQTRRLKLQQLANQDRAHASSSEQRDVIPQLDGDDDDDDETTKPGLKVDEEDEDAINSDLDDPDDDANPIGDEEDDLGDTILCTYDKVQRVKNKWKCILKDGVLNTGGKEYLFHKGNGEFEW